MGMMQQPYLSNDVFEMRVLNRQARQRSVSGALASTMQRVKDSSRGAAFAQWTGKNTHGLVAWGKKAGANMMNALTRFEARAAAFAGALKLLSFACCPCFCPFLRSQLSDCD
jgi:hypothetical protein